MIQLNQCPVVYDPVGHTYHYSGKVLSGITKRIKERVCPDEYIDVPDRVLAEAAEKGHAVHSAVELFDTVGIETDSDEFRGYMVERELHPFLKLSLASEYLVSDNKQFASPIDKVCGDEEEGYVNLVDIKRTAVRNIPYVTWQLSVYKMFFEALNPHLKVKNIYLLWLREDKHLVQQLDPHSCEEVCKMLYTDEPLDLPVEKHASTEITDIAKVEQEVAYYKKAADEAAAKYKELQQGLEKLMVENDIKKYDGKYISITKKADSVRRSFDSKSFEKDNPEMYAKYVKESTTKGGILIKVKETA